MAHRLVYKMHPLRVLVPAAILLLGAGASSGQANQAAYSTDARLAAPITAALRDAPFSELAKVLADASGVDIKAGSAVADDKASIFVKGRPARDLMAEIARHFGMRWRSVGGGYLLEITSDEATLEATLRSRLRERALAALDGRMRALQQLQGYSDQQVDARLKEIAAALGDAGLSKRERAGLTEEQQTLRDFRQPGGRIVATIFEGLTVAQRGQLVAGQQVRIAELPAGMIPEVQKAAGSTGNRSISTMRVSMGGSSDKPPVMPPIDADDKSPATGVSAALRIAPTDDTFMPRAPQMGQPAPGMRLDVTLNSIQGSGGVQRISSAHWSTTAMPEGTPRKDHTADASDPDLAKEVDIRLTPVAAQVGGDAFDNPVQPPLSAVAERIAAASGLNVVADSFVRARIRPGLLAGKRTVASVLDAVSDALDYSWEKDSAGIRLRSNRFYDDRPAEVPGRLLKPLRDRCEAGETIGLDDFAHLASDLTDAQIKGLDSFWGVYFRGSTMPRLGGGRIYPHRFDLRFWAMLGLAQRKIVLDGDVLPVTRMSPPQVTGFVSALTAHDDMMPGMNEPKGEPTRADIAAGGFSLKTGVAHQFSAGMPSADGSSSKAVAIMSVDTGRGGAGGGPAPSLKDMKPHIVGPDGNEISLDQMQQQTLDNFMFSYLLAGNPTPARISPIMIPQTGKKKNSASE